MTTPLSDAQEIQITKLKSQIEIPDFYISADIRQDYEKLFEDIMLLGVRTDKQARLDANVTVERVQRVLSALYHALSPNDQEIKDAIGGTMHDMGITRLSEKECRGAERGRG
ncbi:MAG: hypothetical protein ACN2B6_08765 [Rickettsiales bacterium]